MTTLALLFTLAAIGVAETVYLIRTRRALERPVCIVGQSCSTVLESKYNKLFLFLHNDEMGLFFYLVALVLPALILLGVGDIRLAYFYAAWLIGGARCLPFLALLPSRAGCR